MKRILVGLGAIVLAALIVAVAGYFALRRGDIPYETLEAKYGGPASAYMEMSDGVRLHYRDQGNRDGPPVVLVHGYSASVHTWEPWVALLGFHYRVITLDLPGHGLTRAPENYAASREGFVAIVHEFADKLALERFVLGGNSMGGGVAWRFAIVHPERLNGLILVNAAGWPREGPRNPRGPIIFSLINHPLIGPLLRDLDNRPFVAQGIRAAFADQSKVDDAMIDRYVELSRAPGHRDILRNIEQGVPASEALMAQIAAPTLVLHGDQDNLIPVEHGRRFGETIPNATYVEFENVGHVPMEEIPEESARVVAEFLARIAPPAPADTAAAAAPI